jgi:hypothetical protein
MSIQLGGSRQTRANPIGDPTGIVTPVTPRTCHVSTAFSRLTGLRPAPFFSRLLLAEVLRNVTDKKIFFLKENDIEKGWYVVFVQLILAFKSTRKKPNEFCDANQI